MPKYESRRLEYLIGGMPIRIAIFGDKDGEKVVGEDACPAVPTPENPGVWLYLGDVKSAQVERTKKTAQIEGVQERIGTYGVRDVSFAMQNKLKVTTQYITPEVIQLTFGVSGPLDDGKTVIPFVSPGIIRCWLYGRLTDHADNGKDLAEFCVLCEMSLTNAPNFASDPITAEFDFNIKYSPLATFTSKALAVLATA